MEIGEALVYLVMEVGFAVGQTPDKENYLIWDENWRYQGNAEAVIRFAELHQVNRQAVKHG